MPGERDGEQAIAFTTRAFPVPDMELDLELPIAAGENETPEDAVHRALRQRLHGTVPQAPPDGAAKERREEFRGELAGKGQAHREHRIEHGAKPAEAEERAGRLKPAERKTGPARCEASPPLRPHTTQTP